MAVRIELVQSSLPPLPGFIKLPALDQLATVRSIFSLVLAFELHSPYAKEDALAAIHDGLQATLDEIPFLAAWVVADDPIRGSIQLEMTDGTDTGIKLHVKNIPNLHWDDLKKGGFPTAQLKSEDLTPHPRSASESTPVLTVQTSFITGGILVGLNLSHAVFDGQSLVTFLTQWAKHSAALSNGHMLQQEDRLPRAAFNRSSLFRGHNSMAFSQFPYYRDHDFTEDPKDFFLNKMRGLTSSDFDFAFWRPTDETLNELESLVCGAGPSRFSANALVGAFVWQRVTKARKLSERGETTTNFLFPVNVRDIIVPPLPSTYMGNCIIGARATASVADMEASGPEFLYKLAERISEAKNWVTSDRVRAWIGAMNACPDHIANGLHFDTHLDTHLGSDIMVTNMSSTELDLDWGPTLGKIAAMRPTAHLGIDGLVASFMTLEGSGIELGMAFATKTMKRLMEDELWMRMMTLVCSEQLG